MYAAYTLLFMMASGLVLPRLIWRGLRGGTSLHGWRERLSARPAGHVPDGCLWFHAASVGEVQGLQPLVAALAARFPARPVVVSTFTPSGRDMARRLLPMATRVILLPLDLPWLMRRLVARLRPCLLVVQETELWPHLFRAVARQQVPIALVNGRLSPRAFRRYGWGRPLMRRVLADVTLILAQTESFARRFQALGAPAARLRVNGNTNIDRVLLRAEQASDPSPFEALVQGRRLLVGGSTHEGEERELLAIYRRLHRQHPDLVLGLAPRHLERVPGVVAQARNARCQVVHRSQWSGGPLGSGRPTVLLLDTLGELLELYRVCTLAFVGGSLAPIGGHSILEPAVFAKPVVFGPHMHHFPDLVAMLCGAGGAVQVPNAAALDAAVARLLAHPDDAARMGERARQALQANRGALDRAVAQLCGLVAPARPDGCPPASSGPARVE